MSSQASQRCKVLITIPALSQLQTFEKNAYAYLGPVVQSWVSANPGLKFNPLF